MGIVLLAFIVSVIGFLVRLMMMNLVLFLHSAGIIFPKDLPRAVDSFLLVNLFKEIFPIFLQVCFMPSSVYF